MEVPFFKERRHSLGHLSRSKAPSADEGRSLGE